MKKQQQKEQVADVGRRGFLKGAAATGGAAALVAGTGALAAEQDVAAGKAPSHGYRESGHVRDYYKTARM